MPLIGKIERAPLRDLWRHEAHELTRWLEGNAGVLSDVLGQQPDETVINNQVTIVHNTIVNPAPEAPADPAGEPTQAP